MIKKLWDFLGGKKFLGFAIATGALFDGKMSGEAWVAAFTIYCAANIADKIVTKE